MDAALKTLDEVLKEHVKETLKRIPNRTKASKSLGISIRTLRNYINKWNMEEEVKDPPTNKFKMRIVKTSRFSKKTLRDIDFDCMRNVTPEERDRFESRGCIYLQNKS